MIGEKKQKKEMSLLEFKQRELPVILSIFDFASYIPASVYLESTGVKLPEATYRSSLISETRLISEEYLLNAKRSSLDMGIPIGVFSYSAPGVIGSMAYRHLKDEEEQEKEDNIISLPPYKNINVSLSSVIRSRRSVRQMSGQQMSIQQLSNILFYANGVTGEFELDFEDSGKLKTWSLGSKIVNNTRSAPSGGGLYPVYMYLVIQNTEKINDGIYLYLPNTHLLKKVLVFDDEHKKQLKQIMNFGINFEPEKINLAIFYVYHLYENSRKYGDMGLQFALIEAGEIAQNIHLTCTALNIASSDVGGFEKVPCERFLGIDGLSKHIIHLTVVGV